MPRKTTVPACAEFLLGRPMAMLPEQLRARCAAMARTKISPKALTSWADAPAPNTYQATIRDGIATVRVSGYLQREYDFWMYYFGGTACAVLAKDLFTLRDDPSCRAIVLEIDSGGGDVAGTHELTQVIRSVLAVKPVVAYVAGLGCSAAYWVAAAAREIVVDPTAIVGSIGSIIGFYDFSGYEKKLGIRHITMVSSQSPRKAMDPTTPEGREDWQTVLDDLAAVFIAGVAEFRGVDEATVLAEFGEGSVFVGQAALDAGLADALGTAETVHVNLLAELDAPLATISTEEAAMAKAAIPRTRRPKAAVSPVKATADEGDPKDNETTEEPGQQQDAGAAENPPVDENDEYEEDAEDADAEASANAFAESKPAAAAVLQARGAAAERARIIAIDAVAAKVTGAKAAKLVAAAKADPNGSAASLALALVDSGAMAGSRMLSALDADEEELDAPSGAAGQDVGSGVNETVASIISLHNEHNHKRRLAAGRN